MTTKIQPPKYSKDKGYERYKTELLAWNSVTDIAVEKRGVVIALSLPEEDEQGVRERVFDELGVEDLTAADGLDKLIAHLDKHLGKDDLADSLEKYEDFEDYKRDPKQSMSEFISKFDQKYNRIVKLKMTLPSAILAFMLLKKADITKEEKMLVMTGMNYSEKDTLYEQAKKSLLKFKGEQGGGVSSGVTAAIKLEPAYLANEDEAFWSAGNTRRGHDSYRGRGRPWSQGSSHGGYNGRGRTYQTWRGRATHSRGGGNMPRGRGGRNVNPKGADGNTLLCNGCGSYRHLLAACPDSWENQQSAHIAQEEASGENRDVGVLFAMTDKNAESVLLLNDRGTKSKEAWRCAVLDSACSSTVCGSEWLDDYLSSLDHEDRAKVERLDSAKVFKFGGGERLPSEGSFRIPAKLVGKDIMINTDVVRSDIPLLLSKDAMKRADVNLDLAHDKASILGVEIALSETSSGHYCVPITKYEESVESVCAVDLTKLSERELHKTMVKLHRQFGHPPPNRLQRLLEDAGVWMAQYGKMLDSIHERCETCKIFQKTPSRPVVALPMATRFNERVCMDLKQWESRWILHLVDMWSRFSISVFVNRKRSCDIIDKIMMCWVATFGVMEGILTDNGGEFSSDEMREVCSVLNVVKHTTAAESPFQNGLCERNHAVVDSMLVKMCDQCPNTPVEVLLAWACMAKNSLQMWHGFSSYQLIFGSNPNLPNIMHEKPPALEGATSSEILAKHLISLHAARKAFIESESDERIRRALRGKIRASEENYSPGDSVYYKRDMHNRWLGPAKVVFQDGKVVFVRHGAVYVRVSPNRLVKANNMMAERDVSDDNASNMTVRDKSDDKILSRGGEFMHEEVVERRDIVGEEMLGDVINQPEGRTDRLADRELVTGEGRVRTQAETGRLDLKKDDKIKYRIENEGEWKTATIQNRGGKATGGHPNWFNLKDDDGVAKGVNLDVVEWRRLEEEEEVNMVMVPRKRHHESDCIKAKEVELGKLKEFGVYEEVEDTGQFRISTTWVLWHKGDEVRARLVARGYEDEQNFPKDSPTIGKSTIKIVMAVTACKGWEIQTTDIKSAFLQGKEIDRVVHLTPPPEAREAGKIWRLKHCLYGLNDAARQFYQSVVACLKKNGCEQSRHDPALFLMHQGEEIIGIIACHVDDFLHAGTDKFEKLVMNKVRRRFLAGKIEGSQFRYVGVEVIQNDSGIDLDQSEYMRTIENGSIDHQRAGQKNEDLDRKEQTTFRQLVGKLNWAVQVSRPDMAFDQIDLSTKLKQASVGDLLRAIKIISKLKNESAMLHLPKLADPGGWKLVVFTDAALGNLGNSGSVGAHVIFLMDEAGQACVLSWSAKKIKRVVRSTLSAEMLSLQQGIDEALYVKEIIIEILGRRVMIPICAYVDNRSVVQALYSTRMVDDKRLRLDVASVKQSLEAGEVVEVSWVPGEMQLADCMTKRGVPGYKLLGTLSQGRLPKLQ